MPLNFLNNGYFAAKVGIGTISPGAKLDVNDTNKAINTKGNLFVSTTDTLAADKGGQISLGGVWAGTSQIQFAGIAGRKENATSGNAGGYLQLSTTASSGGILTERMRIDSSGNVKLAITNATSSTTIGKDAGGMWMETAGSTGALSDMRFQARASGAGSYSAIRIKPSNQSLEFSTSNALRMLVNSAGNVQILGIGNKNKGNLHSWTYQR